jgi:hypothetical protein
MRKEFLAILAVIATIIVITFFILIAPSGPARTTVSAVPNGTPLPPLPQEPLPLSERLNSTDLLLREPIGGFRGDLIWLVGPDNATWDYVFYSRDYGPGNVTLSVTEVSSPLNTTPVTPSPGIFARMVPDRFTIEPGTNITTQLVVNITPAGYSHDPVTRTFYVHADVEREKNAVADDWIRVQMADRPTTWLDYQTTGDISEHEITMHQGGRWVGNVTVRLGERGTGPVRVWFEELDCETMGSSSMDTPQPPSPGWPVISVDPAQFVGRSFGTYELQITVSTAAQPVQPGTYCYEIHIDAPDEHTSFSSKVQVIP